ncbi:unnamed protein product [marine sediment metagenome]|uniref:Glycosyl transferase family 1 domain-containing protein n=1 Tax=marine sediment metagenome TaxID=412755 RepID=X1U5K2_9ZZZZ
MEQHPEFTYVYNEFVMDGRTGVLIKIPSEKEISEVILKLLNDKDKMNYLGKSAKNFADENIWTWEKRIDSELKEVAAYTNSADLGVIPFLNICRNYYFASPNKLFEYMSAGLPIAASNFPEIKKIIEKEKIGMVFDPNKPKDIAMVISKILSDETKYDQMRFNSKKVSRGKYNWENEEKKLLRIYAALG